MRRPAPKGGVNLLYHFGCADVTGWHYQGWVRVVVEGSALHASRG